MLELINRFRFNISYISSQENGGPCQQFRMGLLVEDEAEVSRFMREASALCPVRVIHTTRRKRTWTTPPSISTSPARSAARRVFTRGRRRALMVSANQVMQMLDSRDEAPYKTFEYIGRLRRTPPCLPRRGLRGPAERLGGRRGRSRAAGRAAGRLQRDGD